jgi:hypothetical protein
MANRAAGSSIWVALAPAIVRERKIRKWHQGSVRVCLAEDERRDQGDRDRAEDERARRAPAVVGDGDDDRVDKHHQRTRDEYDAGDVGATVKAEAAVRLHQSHDEQGGENADREVDEEDPVPVERLGDHSAGQQADRTASGGNEPERADGLGELVRLGEHAEDHPHETRWRR